MLTSFQKQREWRVDRTTHLSHREIERKKQKQRERERDTQRGRGVERECNDLINLP